MNKTTPQFPPPSPDSAGKHLDVVVNLLLVVTVFIIFGQTIGHGFVNYDDDQYFYANPHVLAGLTWNDVEWAFQTGYASNWHPLTWLSLMLDAQMFGHGATGPHLTNVILHAASAVLLFRLLRRMTGARWRSALVAAVFAIHPLHVESVAWVAERKDVLSGLFFMLTLHLYVRFAEKIPVPKARMFYGLALLFFVLGLMSKPMLVTLPFVLLLLDWWPLKRFESSTISRLVLEKAPFFLLSAASCVATVLAQKEALRSYIPLTDRLANASVSCVTYLVQMVWPVNLAVFYPYPANLTAWQGAGVGALLITVTVLVVLRARKFPFYLVGWLWYLGMLVPVIGLVQAGGQSHADRYTYLPQIGIYITLAWGAADLTVSWRHQRQLLGAAASGMMAVLMIYAWKQTAYWRDGESLWRHALTCTSDNYTAHNNLGYVLDEQGRIAEAVGHYQMALEIYPEYAEADINLGSVFLNEGRLGEAKEYFQRASKFKPGAAEAHDGLGILLAKQGKPAEAFQHYQKAIELNPDHAETYNNLAILLASQGRFDESANNYRIALKLKPDYPDAQNNFGILLARQGRLGEAMEHLQKALEIRGGSAEAENDLGLLLVSLDQAGEAVPHYRKALELKPDFAIAHYNLGYVLANQGQVAEALEHFRKSLALASAQGDSTLESAIKTQMSFYETNSLLKP